MTPCSSVNTVMHHFYSSFGKDDLITNPPVFCVPRQDIARKATYALGIIPEDVFLYVGLFVIVLKPILLGLAILLAFFVASYLNG